VLTSAVVWQMQGYGYGQPPQYGQPPPGNVKDDRIPVAAAVQQQVPQQVFMDQPTRVSLICKGTYCAKAPSYGGAKVMIEKGSTDASKCGNVKFDKSSDGCCGEKEEGPFCCLCYVQERKKQATLCGGCSGRYKAIQEEIAKNAARWELYRQELGSPITQWLISIGLSEKSSVDVMRHLKNPNYNITNLQQLFAVEAKDLDALLEPFPLADKALIKQHRGFSTTSQFQTYGGRGGQMGPGGGSGGGFHIHNVNC